MLKQFLFDSNAVPLLGRLTLIEKWKTDSWINQEAASLKTPPPGSSVVTVTDFKS